MKKSFLLMLWTLGVLFNVSAQSEIKKWYSTLELNGEKLPLYLEVTADGKKVKLFSPRQSEKGFEVQNWQCNEKTMSWQAKSLHIEYSGEWISDSAYYLGQFIQGGFKAPLKWSSKETVTPIKVYNRPQTPRPPFDYNTKELTFDSDDHGKRIQLSGTLVTPKGDGPFPCLIMVSGSGPQNRNEELMGHQPFAVISDALAKKGWATFRYDDRGVAQSEGNFSAATTIDFALDANAAWKIVSQDPSIDSKRVGLLGHSEGGLVAPIVAGENKDIYCIVSMAGPGVSGSQIILQQIEDIAKAEGESENAMFESLNMANAVMTFVRNEKDSLSAAKTIRKYIFKVQRKKSKAVKQAIYNSYNASFNSIWMKKFIDLDPLPYWQKVQCPTLILNGDKDWQVRWNMNANKIADVLLKNQVSFQKVILSDHNHLFQYSETGKVSEYSEIEETISPETLESIVDWLSKLP